MGCVAGVILYFIRGVWYAPRREKIMGGITLLKKRAPILGGTSLGYHRFLRFVGWTLFDNRLFSHRNPEVRRCGQPDSSWSGDRRVTGFPFGGPCSLQKRYLRRDDPRIDCDSGAADYEVPVDKGKRDAAGDDRANDQRTKKNACQTASSIV